MLRLVLGQGLRLVLAGSCLGLIGVAAASQLLAALIPDASGGAVRAIAGVTAVLTTVTLIAAYVPARRAAGIAPAQSLRFE